MKPVPFLLGADYVTLDWSTKSEARSQPGQQHLSFGTNLATKMQEIVLPVEHFLDHSNGSSFLAFFKKNAVTIFGWGPIRGPWTIRKVVHGPSL